MASDSRKLAALAFIELAGSLPWRSTPTASLHQDSMTGKQYRLINASGEECLSAEPGTLGGNRRRKIYGRLDCRSAIGSLPTGYAKHRVFFADEATALAAGYRPCGTCMSEEYRAWVEQALREGKQDLR